MKILDLPTPALLLDLDILELNLSRMAERTRGLGVALRPHVKTHKCLEVAALQRSLGARGITVATLAEAEVFADGGFDDITWAFPLILSRVRQARRLAERVRLGLVVDSREAVAALAREGFPFAVWLKVDCGYHRAGVDPESELALELAERLAASPDLALAGILSHSGHAYRGRTRDEVRGAAAAERRVMADFAARLRGRGIEVPAVSAGSTPGLGAVDDLAGITEVRPGNYALHDYTQTVLGTCRTEDCAATVLASVVSCQPGSGRAVVDAGALALSKDPGPEHGPVATMGEIYRDYPARLHPDLRLTSLSQEHGMVSGELAVGSKVRLLPNHSCLAVACFDQFQVVRGDEVVDRWPIHRGR